jgi:hypothetical protein
LSAYQLTNDNANSIWLRSANESDYSTAYVLCSDGSYNYYGVNSSYSVRPAIHLNLEAAAISAGIKYEVEAPELSSTSAKYTGNSLAFDINKLDTSLVDVTLSEGLTLIDDKLTAVKAGTYTVTFSLKNDSAFYTWSDDTVDDKTISITINKAEIAAEWDKSGTLPVVKSTLPDGAITYKYYKNGTEVAEADLVDGDYTVVATLTEDYATNYIFADTNGDTVETTFTYTKPVEPATEEPTAPATDDNSGYTTDNNSTDNSNNTTDNSTNNSAENNNSTDNSNDTVAPAAKSGCGSTTTNTGDGMIIGLSIALVGAALLVLRKKRAK